MPLGSEAVPATVHDRRPSQQQWLWSRVLHASTDDLPVKEKLWQNKSIQQVKTILNTSVRKQTWKKYVSFGYERFPFSIPSKHPLITGNAPGRVALTLQGGSQQAGCQQPLVCVLLTEESERLTRAAHGTWKLSSSFLYWWVLFILIEKWGNDNEGNNTKDPIGQPPHQSSFPQRTHTIQIFPTMQTEPFFSHSLKTYLKERDIPGLYFIVWYYNQTIFLFCNSLKIEGI